MSWTLIWSAPARDHDIFDIGYHRAERVAMALHRLAETGPAFDPARNPNVWLGVGDAVAWLILDSRARTISVERIYRRS